MLQMNGMEMAGDKMEVLLDASTISGGRNSPFLALKNAGERRFKDKRSTESNLRET